MAAPTKPVVTVHATSLRRLRISRELSRHLLQALAVVGLLASARFAIAPPRPVVVRASTPDAARVDRAAEGFAALFARRYLTWSANDPEAHARSLEPFTGSSMESAAGSQPPESGDRRVLWVEVVQARALAHGRLYTLAAETDTSGLLYLTVGVVRTPTGALALAGYPAFVGAPFATVAPSPAHQREVEDPTLTTVVKRALRNYLARAETELAADVAPGAQVSLPLASLTLESIQSLDWASKGTVVAVVQARDERFAHYTLAYELDVASHAGRWEVSAIQTNPTD